MSLKSKVFNHFKNIPGRCTNRKILVFSVDDFGNLRLDSKDARDKMSSAGLKLNSQFDKFDTLESREDLESLFDVLCSVKDKNGNYAVFTPYAVPCNLDFESVINNNYSQVITEQLPLTYQKLSGRYPKIYEGAWDLWKDGIKMKIFMPQFHGREHFNFKTIQNRLNESDNELIIAIKNRSLTGLTHTENESPFTVAFAYQDFNENIELSHILEDGLKKFEETFGYKATAFMPPSATISACHHQLLSTCGIKSLDTFAYKSHSYDKNNFKKELRWTGKQVQNFDMAFIVRNAVFEPSHDLDALEKCKSMIEAAFRMRKPAIVSSHRINFVGLIDEKIRINSLNQLKKLLQWVVKRYPDVEFINVDNLQKVIRKSSGVSNL